MREIWKDLNNYGNKYQVSNLGRIRNKETKNEIKQYIHRKYKYVALYYDGKTHNCRVHRLIAQEFCENYSNNCVVMHLDNNPINNNYKNLKCGTQKENIIQCRNEHRIHIPSISKKTNQYDLNGNFIKQWNSLMDIERILGFNHRGISRCCIGQRKKAYGYIWKYSN